MAVIRRFNSKCIRKILFVAAWAWLFAGFGGQPAAQENIVKMEVLHSQDRYQPGKTYPLLLRLSIAAGWYIHGDQLRDPFAFPTRLVFEEHPFVKIESLRFPEAEKKKFAFMSEPLELFKGTILVQAGLTVKENTPAGEQLITGRLEYQACTSKSCVPIEELPVKIVVPFAGSGQAVQKLNLELFARFGGQEQPPGSGFFNIKADWGFWLTLLGFVLVGMILNLTPCVYPLISITVAYFGGAGGRFQGRIVIHALCYLTGLTVTNTLLLFPVLWGSLQGAILQNPLTLVFIALLLIVLALSFFGFWELRLPATLSRLAARNFKGYFGTFFVGLTMGIVAAPCLGPFIIGSITFISQQVAQQGDLFRAFLYVSALSFGLGLPLAVLALFSGLIEKLPHSGEWMVWVRSLFGWVMIGMAVHVINPVMPSDLVEYLLWAGAAFAAGIHLGWLERSGEALPGFLRLKRTAGWIMILAGVVFSILTMQPEKAGMSWVAYEQEQMTRATRERKPAILDFTAKWCVPCQIMEKRVFKSAEVVRLGRDFALFKVDLTVRHPLQKQIMDQYGIRGVPSILFFNRRGQEEKDLRIEEPVSRAEFLRRMKELLRRAGGEIR